jgi:hypothetical protein
MANAKKDEAVDVPSRATPLEAGDPVEAVSVTQAGSTFADRSAARKKAEARAVKSAENKSVKSADSK